MFNKLKSYPVRSVDLHVFADYTSRRIRTFITSFGDWRVAITLGLQEIGLCFLHNPFIYKKTKVYNDSKINTNLKVLSIIKRSDLFPNLSTLLIYPALMVKCWSKMRQKLAFFSQKLVIYRSKIGVFWSKIGHLRAIRIGISFWALYFLRYRSRC